MDDLAELQRNVQALRDDIDVRELMARYHRTCDGWGPDGTHRDPDAIAQLFTDDGTWAVTARDPAPTGRSEIAALARDLQSVAGVVHFALNGEVQIDGDSATGQFKGLLRVRMTPTSPAVWSIGRYDLLAQRDASGWLIKSLTWEPMTSREPYDPAQSKDFDPSQ